MDEASQDRGKQRAYAIWRKATDELLIEAIFGSGTVVSRDGDVFVQRTTKRDASTENDPNVVA